MNIFWLLKMKRWSQNPPSKQRIMVFLAVITICVGIVLIEKFIGWPDALTVEPTGRARVFR